MNLFGERMLVVAVSCLCALAGLGKNAGGDGQVVIGGRITQEPSGAPLAGATVTFAPGNWVAVTDTNGVYTQSVVRGWSGTATPGCAATGTFSPATRRYNKVTNHRTHNYVWKAAEIPAIEGRVRLSDSDRPLAGVVITFSGLGSATTDAEGRYRYEVPMGWSGTASAAIAGGGTFSPKMRRYTKIKKLRPEQGYVWHAPELATTTGSAVWSNESAMVVRTMTNLLTVTSEGVTLGCPVAAPGDATLTSTVNEAALAAVCGGNPTGLVLIVVHGTQDVAVVEAPVADTSVHGQAKMTVTEGRTTLVWDLTLTSP